MYPTTSQNPRRHPSWLSSARVSESNWPETTRELILSPWNTEAVNHVVQQPWVSFPSWSLPRHPFPIKFLDLSAKKKKKKVGIRKRAGRRVDGLLAAYLGSCILSLLLTLVLPLSGNARLQECISSLRKEQAHRVMSGYLLGNKNTWSIIGQ